MSAEQPVEPGTLEDLLRSALRGPAGPTARAAVAAAAAALGTAGPSDPGSAEQDPAHRAAQRLAALLTGAGAQPNLDEPQVPARVGESQTQQGLREVALAFAADVEVARWVGDGFRVLGSGDGDTWLRLWLACLRLPGAVADRWRASAMALLRPPTEPEWCEIPGPGAVLVAPGPGVPGLRESETAEPGPVVAGCLPADAGYPTVRVLAGQVEAMLSYDDTLCYALEERRRGGFLRLGDDGNRTYLLRDLRWRLGDLVVATHRSEQALRELYRVDELLCSVIHLPPAHPQSWWGTLAQRSRSALAECAAAVASGGTAATVRPVPLGDFGAQRELVGPYNVACPAPGRPESEILACLRTWMRLGSEVHPGRVVHVRNGG